jgi:hypothetical protein
LQLGRDQARVQGEDDQLRLLIQGGREALLVGAGGAEVALQTEQGTTLAPQTRCNYVWSSNQSLGALTCRDVPSTSSQLTYQLWATRGDKVIPLAAFTPRPDGSASVLVKYPSDPTGPVTDMWVTLEAQAAARTRPSSEIVMQRTAPQQVQR